MLPSQCLGPPKTPQSTALFTCSRAGRWLCKCPHHCSWSSKDRQRWRWTGWRDLRWPAWSLCRHERSLSRLGQYPSVHEGLGQQPESSQWQGWGVSMQQVPWPAARCSELALLSSAKRQLSSQKPLYVERQTAGYGDSDRSQKKECFWLVNIARFKSQIYLAILGQYQWQMS